MAKSFPDILVTELEKFFKPLENLAKNPDQILDYGESIGLTLDPTQQQQIETATTITLEISDQSTTPGNQLSIIERIEDLIEVLTDVTSDLPRLLFHDLLYRYLNTYRPKIFAILHICGIIQKDDENRADIRWDRLGKLISSPKDIFEDPELYNWGNRFNTANFFARLEYLFHAFQLPGGIYQREGTVTLGAGTISAEDFRIPIYMSGVHGEGNYKEITLNLAEIVIDNTTSGLYLYPYLAANAEFNFDIGESWELIASAGAELDNGIGISLTPPLNLDFVADVLNPANTFDFVNFNLGLSIERKEDADGIIIYGEEGKTMVSLSKLSFPLFGGIEDNVKDLGFEINIGKIKIDIRKGLGGGFLDQIIPEEGMLQELGLGLGYSIANGFYLTDSTSLTFTIPTHITIGPIELFEIGLYVNPTENFIEFGAFTQLRANIGPIVAVVEEMGVKFRLPYPDIQNPSILEPSIGLKPPAGVGLAIDAEVVKGGGYLYFNFDKGEYAGVGEITIKELISVAAIALITTKPPPGTTEPGFSLLILIAAEFQPIQLSYGFTLLGIGGLFAANRTMDLDALRAGVSNGTVDNILFPDDPVANAPQIIDQLNAVFPIEANSFTFGIMTKLGWGTPTLIAIELGLIVKLPMPIKIAILGVLKSELPTKELAILTLKVSFVGTIDIEYNLITFDASLEGSELLGLRLYGEMAFRLRWGNEPMFILCVGGFHPEFIPPEVRLPPILRRITLEIFPENPRLIFTGYFAITPNTLQFGAGIDLYIQKGKFNITGFINFNTLIQFNPFYLIIALDASLSVKWGDMELMGISFGGSVEGPSPWIIKGYAEFRVIIKIKVDVSKTIGPAVATNVPDIEVLPLLLEELAIQDNFSVVFGEEINVLAESRYVAEDGDFQEEKGLLILHPAGKLGFKQTKIPLNVKLEKIGSRNVIGDDEFSLVFANSNELESHDLKENFAAAEFFDLSNDQKLSRPSFEKYDAGIELVEDFISFSDHIEIELEYEEEVIDAEFKEDLKVFVDMPSRRKFIKISDTKFNYFKSANKLHSMDLATKSASQNTVVKDIKIVDTEVVLVYDGNSSDSKGKTATEAYREREMNILKGENVDFEIMSKHELFV